jgi:hypothetical protein
VAYLIVRRSKSSAHVLVIQNHHLEGEIFPQLYKAEEQNYNHQKQHRCVQIAVILTFLIIITKKGSLMPRVFLGSAGH